MILLDVTASTVSVAADNQADMVAASAALAKSLKSKNHQAHMINSRISAWGTPVPYWHEAYDLIARTFPRGLLQRACIALHQADLKFQITDLHNEWKPLTQDVWWSSNIMPRDYQWAAVQNWQAAQFGTVVVPTRGGKTLIGCLATSLAIPHMPVLWLVTKNEAQLDVVTTWHTHFGGYPAAGDYLMDGLSVLTYATATKRDLSHYGLVIADEVHRAAADTYYKAIQSATKAWYRLGLTGTPKGRSDGKEIFIEGAIGPVCYTVSRQLLIERSLCSSGITRRVILDDDMFIDGGHGNWTQIERVGIVENLKRDTLLLAAAKDIRDGDDQILILCRRQAHAEALAENASLLFDYPVKAMHSRRSKKERKDAYEAFASGRVRIIVATGIYDDSMTFPHLKILVNAAGGKSTILTGQRLGRVLAGDKKITIIDCSDEHYETLRVHAKKRMRVYEKEGYPVTDWRFEA